MIRRDSSLPFLQIVGSGAIGSLIAAGAETAHAMYGLAPRCNSAVTRMVHAFGGQTVHLAHNQGARAALGEEDILILPLKAYQLDAAAKQWSGKIASRTPVVLLHNGMGGVEQVQRYFSEQPLFLATTTHGAMKSHEHEVSHTGPGRTYLGPAPGSAIAPPIRERVVQTFNSCLPPVVWREDIMVALWEKLAVNAVINPLTAVNNIRNGELASPEYQHQIIQICSEVAAVMCAEGHPAQSNLIHQKVLAVITATAQNYSSMQQDIINHRATEIDAINGYIVQQAQKKGIEVPLNTLLYNQVVSLSAARL